MNEYDSEKMLDVLNDSDGMELTDNAEEADVLLLNTCSIREKAQEKVFHQLGRWRKIKEKNPDVIIGVGGCVASQEGKAIRQRAPVVDVVFQMESVPSFRLWKGVVNTVLFVLCHIPEAPKSLVRLMM